VSLGKKQFSYATNQAIFTGTVLALFLMHSDFINDRVVSIIGYSLGTIVTLQTIKILNRCYKQGFAKAGRIVHDIYLWAGAAVLAPNG